MQSSGNDEFTYVTAMFLKMPFSKEDEKFVSA